MAADFCDDKLQETVNLNIAQDEQDVISKTIKELKEKYKQRPDRESTSRHLTARNGLVMEVVLNTINNMIESKKIIVKKTIKGDDSFFLPVEGLLEATDKSINKKTTTQPSLATDVETRKATYRKTSKDLPLQLGSHAELGIISSPVLIMVESINYLNTMLQNERGKSANLQEENFSLRMAVKELEWKIERLIADNTKIHTKATDESNSSLKTSEKARSKEAKINNMVDQNGVVDTNTSEEINDNTPKRKKETNQSQLNAKRCQIAKRKIIEIQQEKGISIKGKW